MRCQELLFGASILGAAIALNNCRHSRNMRPESARCQPGTPVTIKTDPLSSLRCPGFVFRSLPATPEPAGRTRTSGVPRVTARPTGKAGTQYFKISSSDGTIHLAGFLSPQRSEISISASQAPDRSTFCPMPGGRSQTASDAPRTEAVLLGQLSLSRRRAPAGSVDSARAH